VKNETINNPKPKTARSPNRSTNRPENRPDEKRIIAKAETIKPIAVLFTPKDAANIGMAGMIKPKPIATKKETVERIATSLGSSLNGFFSFKLLSHCSLKNV
jgi:hypothetical protein